MSASSRSRASPALVDRELNGTQLLEEAHALRAAGVPQQRLEECSAALSAIDGLDPARAAEALSQLAIQRMGDVPALAQLLLRWAPRLRLPDDVPLFLGHFRRLAFVSAMLAAVWRAGAQLTGGDKPRG